MAWVGMGFAMDAALCTTKWLCDHILYGVRVSWRGALFVSTNIVVYIRLVLVLYTSDCRYFAFDLFSVVKERSNPASYLYDVFLNMFCCCFESDAIPLFKGC